MPPARSSNYNRSVSPAETPSPSSHAFYADPPTLQKKKRSHGKARPPGHIPRPPNAFIVFRTEYIRAMETQNSTPEVSKSLGELWRSMTDEQKQPYVDKAAVLKLEHKAKYPDYRYKPVHPRDENGNCIRKPRKPNSKPRMTKAQKMAMQAEREMDMREGMGMGDIVEELDFRVMEGSTTGMYTDSPPPMSPPSTPGLSIPSAPQVPLPNHFYRRRSSSVPAVLNNDAFFYAPMGIPSGYSLNTAARRLSMKRPSTSMDFTCAGPSSAFADAFAGHEQLYAQPQPQAPSAWRPTHRRSISAPGLGLADDYSGGGGGGFASANGNHGAYGMGFAPETNTLTPINPVFGNVFDRFAWPSPSSHHASSSASSIASFNLADFAADHPTHLQVTIPPTSYSTPSTPTPHSSALPSAASSSSASSSAFPPSPDESSALPAISSYHKHAVPGPVPTKLLHPSPVTKFDVTAFEAHIKELETYTGSLRVEDSGAGVVGVGVGVDAVGFDRAGQQQQQQREWDAMGVSEGVFVGEAGAMPGIQPPKALNFNELIVDSY